MNGVEVRLQIQLRYNFYNSTIFRRKICKRVLIGLGSSSNTIFTRFYRTVFLYVVTVDDNEEIRSFFIIIVITI